MFHCCIVKELKDLVDNYPLGKTYEEQITKFFCLLENSLLLGASDAEINKLGNVEISNINFLIFNFSLKLLLLGNREQGLLDFLIIYFYDLFKIQKEYFVELLKSYPNCFYFLIKNNYNNKVPEWVNANNLSINQRTMIKVIKHGFILLFI